MPKRESQSVSPVSIPAHNTPILIIESDGQLLDSLSKRFSALGYAVQASTDGKEGYSLAMTRKYPVVILGLLVPGKDGLSIIRDLRRNKNDCMILVLSVKCMVEDRVEALHAGADDFLTKPFAFQELHARIEALLRRYRSDLSAILRLGELELDTITRIARREDKTVRLTEKEFLLLEYLMRNQNRVVTRSEIAKYVWGTILSRNRMSSMPISSIFGRNLTGDFQTGSFSPYGVKVLL